MSSDVKPDWDQTRLGMFVGSFVVIPVICFFLGAAAADFLTRPRSIAWVIAPWALGVIYLGVGLYLMRRAARLLYGIVEVIAAVALTTVTFVQSIIVLGIKRPDEVFSGQGDITAILQVAAALYVLVRGLDNIGEGLKKYPKAESMWTAIFPTDLWTRLLKPRSLN
jgi:hypothetical protein